jgi:acyl-coenzyme A thioesterase PaaI-like protein
MHDMMRLFSLGMKVDKMAGIGEFDLDVVSDMIHTAIPMARHSKIELLELSRGHCKMRMPFEPNSNHVGTMYAGALFTLAEIPGGAILLSAFDM